MIFANTKRLLIATVTLCVLSLAEGLWASTARVLIVASNNMVQNACGPCYSPWDLYHENFLALFDQWNDIYANSNMDYHVEIAGVIWDKTYDDQVDGLVSFGNISNPSHSDLGKYHTFLEEYSADYLVLFSHQLAGGFGAGWAGVFVPTVGNPAVFWTDNVGGHIWAHEAGHKHGLNHCDGYRQTYDALNNFVTVGGVWGFHTIMQYMGGEISCPSSYVGSTSVITQSALAFADPNETLNGEGVYPLGDPGAHANTVPNHNAADASIRVLFNTPNTIDLDSSLNVGEVEYASFIASSQVRLHSGFKIKNGLVHISVGSQAMTKRGISKDSYAYGADPFKDSSLSFVQRFDIMRLTSGNTVQVEYEGEIGATQEISIYDATGRSLRPINGFKMNRAQRRLRATLDLTEFGSGEYYLRLRVGGKNLYKRFVL